MNPNYPTSQRARAEVMEDLRLARDIVSNEHNSTVATPASAAPVTLRSRRRRSAVGPIKTVSIVGLIGAFVAAIALPAFAGTAAPAAPTLAAVEAGPEEQPQELVVASTVDDKELDRNSLSATSAGEIAEAKAAAEAEAQRQAMLALLASQADSSSGSPALASLAANFTPSGNGSVVWPLPAGSWTMSDSYGERWGTLHAGQDMAASGGTPIYAVADGVVTRSSYWNTYGNAITIQHVIDGERWETLYAHQRDDCGLAVSVGEYVTAGQYIGCVGTTGLSYGNHLHFEVHRGSYNNKANAVNPLNWLYNYAG